MKLLTLSQLRFLRFAPWSTLTVLIGVTLAVSSIVAVHQISQRVVVSLEEVTPPYLRNISHLLERPNLSMNDYFDLRARWRAGELPDLQGLMPLVDGSVVAGERSVRLIGLDAFSGITETLGLALLPPGQLIGSSEASFEPGDRLALNGRDYRIALTHEAVPADMLVTDVGTAQVVLGRTDEYLSRIAVSVATAERLLRIWSDRLLPGLSAAVQFPGWQLPGWQVRSLESDLPSLGFARSVLFNLGALGSLALVVAWLLVYQVGVIWLRRRQLTLTRLRQMGVEERELRFGFLASLFGIGLLASGLGILLGDALAAALAQATTGYSGDETDISPPIDRWVVSKSLASAVLVCVVGGWIAYNRELRQVPFAAGRRFWLLLVLLAGGGGTLLTESLLGGFVGIAAVGLLVLGGIRPLLFRLRNFSQHVGGRLLTRLGLRELVWYPADLAVAVGALVLALATSVAIALMVDSFRHDFEQMLDRRMVQDLFIAGDGRDLNELAGRLAELEPVTRVQRYGRTELVVSGQKVALGYTAFDLAESARYGLNRQLESGTALISERLARTLDLAAGDTVSLGSGRLTVAGIFAGFGDPVPRVLVNEADARALGIATRFDRLSIETSAPEAVMAFIEARAPALEVQERRSIRATALRIFDQTFSITRALTFLALIVASVGLYNALLALELLQQRTRLLLHAMGVSGAEQKAVKRWRICGVGLAAISLALPLGLVMGWLLCAVINPRAFGWSLNLQLTWQPLVWPVLSAAGVMLLIAFAPTPAEGVADES